MGIKGYNVWGNSELVQSTFPLVEADFSYKAPLIYNLQRETYSEMISGDIECAEEVLSYDMDDWKNKLYGRTDRIELDDYAMENLEKFDLPDELLQAIQTAKSQTEQFEKVVVLFDRKYKPSKDLPDPDECYWIGNLYSWWGRNQ